MRGSAKGALFVVALACVAGCQYGAFDSLLEPSPTMSDGGTTAASDAGARPSQPDAREEGDDDAQAPDADR